MFQIVGFLIAFLFSTTHAGKSGARAGFGLLMIQYGMFIRQDQLTSSAGAGGMNADSGAGFSFDEQQQLNSGGSDDSNGGRDISLWVSYLLMILGWFIVIQASTDYIRAKRMERAMLQPAGNAAEVHV